MKIRFLSIHLYVTNKLFINENSFFVVTSENSAESLKVLIKFPITEKFANINSMLKSPVHTSLILLKFSLIINQLIIIFFLYFSVRE